MLLRHGGSESNAHAHANLRKQDLRIGFERVLFLGQSNLDYSSNGKRTKRIPITTSDTQVRGSTLDRDIRFRFMPSPRTAHPQTTASPPLPLTPHTPATTLL